VTRQDHTLMADRVGQMDLITAPDQAHVGRDFYVMSVAAEQSEEAGIDAVHLPQ
jgi:hypothetical protein